MFNRLPISVHILTWNSGRTLRRALESVRSCAEILVIDGGSTDDTLAIAKEYGARVIPQRRAEEQNKPLENFSAPRNRGLEAATFPWILSLDSDEIASEELLKDMDKTIKENQICACYVPRKYLLSDGTVIRYATTYPNKRLYYFHKDAVVGWTKSVHERPEVKPGIPIKHFRGASLAPLGSFEEFWQKNMHYLDIEQRKAVSLNRTEHGWSEWRKRLRRTLRSRLYAFLKLIWIWCIPRPGKRLPLRHEWARVEYACLLLWRTCPLATKHLDRRPRVEDPLLKEKNINVE